MSVSGFGRVLNPSCLCFAVAVACKTYVTIVDKKTCVTLRTLNSGNYVIPYFG